MEKQDLPLAFYRKYKMATQHDFDEACKDSAICLGGNEFGQMTTWTQNGVFVSANGQLYKRVEDHAAA